MKVPGIFYATPNLMNDIMNELKVYVDYGTVGGFLPALKQIANVASLPGIVNAAIGLPDIHAGYGFAIGNVAAFDMSARDAVVSPGGVGFDINCGVRLIRTNLNIKDWNDNIKEEIASSIFETIPVGVGASGAIKLQNNDLDKILNIGIDWAIENENQIAWEQDKQHCEELGCMQNADASLVSQRAKSRGISQAGTLGAGNHYIEVQVIDEIYKEKEAKIMGLNEIGQVCVQLHSGSRGLGHQVCTDYLKIMDNVMYRDNIYVNDRQLSCAYLHCKEANQYLSAMGAAANFAWVNRSTMTYLIRKSFEQVFKQSSLDMDMNIVYDVSHNMAKQEDHIINNEKKTLLVHRKGATRAMPANHPLTPQDYQICGQPVLIGGSMGTHSYVLVGTEQALSETFGSCVHGAGRTLSRAAARRNINSQSVLSNLSSLGIVAKVANPSLVQEEADKSYKSVYDVVEACTKAGLSSPVVRLKPICVIKG
jgi:tRNA-splicing ligase RtcB